MHSVAMAVYNFVLLYICLFIFGTIQYPQSKVKIVGGHMVKIENVPFMASLRVDGLGHVCGASIVDEQYILTAAHCIRPKFKYRVAVGTDDIYFGGQKFDIESIIVHEKYINTSKGDDICLLKLAKPLKFREKVDKIELSKIDDSPKKGTNMEVTGWGITKINGSVSEKLLQVSVPAIENIECNKIFNNKVNISSRMICAGKQGRDSCKGDSGGPLTLNGVQIGIVSFGGQCGRKPGIYTKVGAYKEWIAAKMK